MTTANTPHPGYPAYYYGDSKGGSMSEISEVGIPMKRYGSQPSISAHSMGSRSMLYGSRRSLYSTYTVSGMSYILPVMTKSPNPYRRPMDNWPIAFCSVFFNPLFGIFAILLAEQSKIYYAKCDYMKASQYGVYAKGAAAGGMFCTVITLMLIIAIVCWDHFRYTGY
ncbi:uncharacterized protein [Littorina saxatilis]|uniref:Uncharacterized protein n=1 Tax=Littorina saxatilis TaxID=31220 RepID=A0AAN9ASE6_9CAEN